MGKLTKKLVPKTIESDEEIDIKENSTARNNKHNWKSPFNSVFIELWQAIFNRRIVSCGPFAV